MKPKRKKATKALPAKRVPLSLRVTPELKAKLDRAAEETGRSQTQEMEMRLERSFQQEGQPDKIIMAKYGNFVGRLLIMAGAAIKTTGSFAVMAGILPESAIADSWVGEDAWIEDPFLFDEAAMAVSLILEANRPAGEIVKPEGIEHLPMELGTLAAQRFLNLLASGMNDGKSFDRWREGIRPPERPLSIGPEAKAKRTSK